MNNSDVIIHVKITILKQHSFIMYKENFNMRKNPFKSNIFNVNIQLTIFNHI